jgi:phosphoglycolate phosphatase-like HAD superfamily hydrolase
MTRELVLVFDMDGVLFDTESVKITAFRDAFADLCGRDPSLLAQVSEYNQTHRGIPRDTKIRYVLTTLLGMPEAHDQVAARYAALLKQRLPDCAPVAGVTTFLREVTAIRYVASSAPVQEIQAQLDRHNIGDLFAGAFGYPHTKTQALRAIAARHPAAARAFFGDAPADRDAAHATETPFVAINPNPALAATVKDYFDDFSRAGTILARVNGAGQRHHDER